MELFAWRCEGLLRGLGYVGGEGNNAFMHESKLNVILCLNFFFIRVRLRVVNIITIIITIIIIIVITIIFIIIIIIVGARVILHRLSR